MNLSCGIVGLPNVGKSTLFNAILARQVADCANYPFCTIEPNVGVIEVPDERLSVLAKLVGTQKIVPAVVKFVDIAGLVAGAHKGEGLGNKFLSHIREVNLILYVLRAFEDNEIIRAGSVDPGSDFETLQTELILADLETLEKQKAKPRSESRFDRGSSTSSGLRSATGEVKGAKAPKDIIRSEAVQKLKAALNEGKPARNVELSKEEKEEIKSLNLLTAKQAMAVLNISEKDIAGGEEVIAKIAHTYPRIAESVKEIVPISAKIEFELKSLSLQDRIEYLTSLGIKKSGMDVLIPQVFYALGLINFLTAGEKEARAWTIEKGTDAQHAAGAIHSDFEKNFVRAAVIPFEEFVQYKGWKEAQEAGKVRYEGKEYMVQDGDVVEFLVNKNSVSPVVDKQ